MGPTRRLRNDVVDVKMVVFKMLLATVAIPALFSVQIFQLQQIKRHIRQSLYRQDQSVEIDYWLEIQSVYTTL